MNTKNWKYFTIGDLFNVELTKGDIKADRIDYGSIPLVSSGESNNGIVKYIKEEGDGKAEIFSAGNLTIDMFCHAYFQPNEFYAVGHGRVNILQPKFKINSYIGIFLCSLINRELYRFSYGRAVYSNVAKLITIKLPFDNNGNPDWQWIEDYVKKTLVPKLPDKPKSVWKKNFDTKPLLDKKLSLNTNNWHWFRYDEVFKICKGFYNKKPEESINGEIPFIGATDSNNGITSFHDLETIEHSSKTGDIPNAPLNDKIFNPNCVTVSNNGSVGYAFYQPREFTCTHDVNPLYLNKKWGKELNIYISMFLCTIIEMEQFRWAYGRKWRPKRMPASLIKLPAVINVRGEYEPDWQWMEDYIKGLPYSACL